MPAGVEVEDSYTSNLKDILKSGGLDAYFKKTYSTVDGRKEPDITIETPQGLFLLEAKVPPAGLAQAMTEAHDYREAIGKTETVKGIFAVVYAARTKGENEIWFAFGSGFDFAKFKSLEKVAGWIGQKVAETLSEQPRPAAVVSTQKVIAILNESVALINQSLEETAASEIEGVLGGRDFFSTVLDYDQESHISDSALKSAASYLLLNQILFYQILSNEIQEYEKIDVKALSAPGDLHERYFKRVLKDDYRPIFGFNVSSVVKGGDSTGALRTAIKAVQLLSPQMLTHDLLGKIFHNLIPLSFRKIVAAYYTNSEAAELLAGLAIEKKNDKVIDPACGSGTLLVAAYNRKRELYGKFGPEQHARFLEHEIFGCDIMPFAAHLAAVNLALQAPLSFTNTVNVAIKDSTELAPGLSIRAAQEVIKTSYRNFKITDFSGGAPAAKPRIKKGAIDLTDGGRSSIKLPKFDVVIMNPPFTRFQRIPPHFKAKLQSRFSSIRHRKIVHGQLGLHGYFILLADKLLAPEGRLAAVLPLTTVSLEGFYGIIDLLLKQYQIEHVVVSSGRAAFSENTSLREMLLVAKKVPPVPEHRVKFTFIHASPEELSVAKAREISQGIMLADVDKDEAENDDFYLRHVNQYELIENVRALYQNVTLHSPALVRIEDKCQRYFSPGRKFEILADVEKREKWRISENPRGVEARGYYCMSLLADCDRPMKDHDVWVIKEETESALRVRHRFNGQEFRIPRNCVVPQFRRFSGQEKLRLGSPRDYVVVREFPDFEAFLMASAMLERPEAVRIRNSVRQGEWSNFVTKNSAQVFGFYRGDITASGTNFMAIRSDKPAFAGPGGSWVFHTPPGRDMLTPVWLNSSIVLYHILRDRKETRGGFIELDKYVFENVPYPRGPLIAQDKLQELEKEVARMEFPSLLEQFQTGFEGRKMIDRFFLDYAGMAQEEQERFLKLLYETMAKELLRLKGVMGK